MIYSYVKLHGDLCLRGFFLEPPCEFFKQLVFLSEESKRKVKKDEPATRFLSVFSFTEL